MDDINMLIEESASYVPDDIPDDDCNGFFPHYVVSC